MRDVQAFLAQPSRPSTGLPIGEMASFSTSSFIQDGVRAIPPLRTSTFSPVAQLFIAPGKPKPLVRHNQFNYNKNMHLLVHTPSAPLRAYVKSMILYEGYSGTHQYEILLPDGNMQLVIALDDQPRIRIVKKRDVPLRHAWVTGVQTERVIYRSEQNASTLTVQFEIGGLYALMGIPAAKFENGMVEAMGGLEPWVNRLREQLVELPFDKRLVVAEQYLWSQIQSKSSPVPLLQHAIQALPHQSLRHISDEVGYSQKHLIALFKQYVGVSPKKYARLQRFKVALWGLANDQSLSQLAQMANYYDQAHMSNEFRQFTGVTPIAYRLMKRDYPHVLPLDSIR